MWLYRALRRVHHIVSFYLTRSFGCCYSEVVFSSYTNVLVREDSRKVDDQSRCPDGFVQHFACQRGGCKLTPLLSAIPWYPMGSLGQVHTGCHMAQVPWDHREAFSASTCPGKRAEPLLIPNTWTASGIPVHLCYCNPLAVQTNLHKVLSSWCLDF